MLPVWDWSRRYQQKKPIAGEWQGDSAQAYVRRRALSMVFDRPLLQAKLPRCLQIDQWTNTLLLYASENSVSLSNLNTFVKQDCEITSAINDAVWYPFDSGLFVTCSVDKVRLWDTARLASVRSFKISSRCNQLSMSSVPSSAGIIAVATSHGEIRLINLLSGSAALTLVSGIDAEILSLSWSPRDSHILISGGADSRLLVWDIRKPTSCLASLDELNQEYSFSSARLLRGQHRLPQVMLPNRLSTAHSRAAVTSVTFVDDGRCILSTGSDGSVHLWRESSILNYYHNSQVSFSRKLAGPWGALGFHLSYSKTTGLVFATAPMRDNVIDAFDSLSGQHLASYSAHVRKVRCIAYREDNDAEMYTAADDGFVLKWCCKPKLDMTEGVANDVDDEDYWSS